MGNSNQPQNRQQPMGTLPSSKAPIQPKGTPNVGLPRRSASQCRLTLFSPLPALVPYQSHSTAAAARGPLHTPSSWNVFTLFVGTA